MGNLVAWGSVECAEPQTPRWRPGHVMAGEDLDSLRRPAFLPLNPVGEIKCLRKAIRSHEMTCGQGLGSSKDFLLRWLIYLFKNMY